jgi:hypothetical protein
MVISDEPLTLTTDDRISDDGISDTLAARVRAKEARSASISSVVLRGAREAM